MTDENWKNTSEHYSRDPFPEIAPSLLNSADILRYASEGCLVHPFSRDPELHNPATYTMSFLGTLHSWTQEGTTRYPKATPIEEGQPVELAANSISYLETKEVFRLPQYIAARFNLHILHVHRGILLGTGPVVHPGFVGPLLVPLHNLTANTYRVIGGDKLLWVEFTKLTRHAYWCRPRDEPDNEPADLMVSRHRNLHLDAPKYFEKAGVLSQGVISAFKGALADSTAQTKDAHRAATDAAHNADAAALKAQQLTSWGGIAIAIGVGALLLAAWQLWQANSEMSSCIDERLDRIELAIADFKPGRSDDADGKSDASTAEDGEDQPPPCD